jgi:hypothetical protein
MHPPATPRLIVAAVMVLFFWTLGLVVLMASARHRDQTHSARD